MLTIQESNVLHRARRDGTIEVAWDSTADRACEALVQRGWLREKASRPFATPITIIYEVTEEGKHG